MASSGKGLSDGKFSQFFKGGDSGATAAGWVVSVGFGDTFDAAEDVQALEMARELFA